MISPNISGRLPAQPTHWPPGSREKIAVMAERARNGELLWHPDDAQDYAGFTGFNWIEDDENEDEDY